MRTDPALIVNVVELVRKPASRRHVHVATPAHDLHVGSTVVPEGAELEVDVELESLRDGTVMVAGTIAGPWLADCRRCLQPATGMFRADVRELYRQGAKDDDADGAFPFDGEHVDLDPMVREDVLLELPLAPLCRPDCKGLCPVCGANRNDVDCGHDERPRDERFNVLDVLRDQLPSDGTETPPV